MGNFAEDLNLGKCVLPLPPLIVTYYIAPIFTRMNGSPRSSGVTGLV